MKTLQPGSMIYLAIPSYTETVPTATMISMCNTIVEMARRGVGVKIQVVGGDAFIDRARDAIHTLFLQMPENCTDLLMVDDDMMWETGAVPRILKHPVDLVAGLYPSRRDRNEFMLRWHHINLAARPDARTGLMLADSVPTGFFRVTRAGARRMAEKYKHRWYADPGSKVKGRVVHLFPRGPNWKDRTYWGEDYGYCQLWNQAGGQIWVDPWLKFGHIGTRMNTNCFGTHKSEQRLEILRLAREEPEKLSEEMKELLQKEPEQVRVQEWGKGVSGTIYAEEESLLAAE